jgi:hypothetical protein
MLSVHIRLWVNGQAIGRAFAPAGRPEVPPAQCCGQPHAASMLAQTWSPSLLQLARSPCGPYPAMGKWASDRKGNGSGGQTKSAPPRAVMTIYGCMWSLKNGPRHFSSYQVMLSVHISLWVNGQAIRRSIAVAARPKVPPTRHYDHIRVYVVTQKWFPSLLQLPGSAFGPYKSLGKLSRDSEIICSGGETRSAARTPL